MFCACKFGCLATVVSNTSSDYGQNMQEEQETDDAAAASQGDPVRLTAAVSAISSIVPSLGWMESKGRRRSSPLQPRPDLTHRHRLATSRGKTSAVSAYCLSICLVCHVTSAALLDLLQCRPHFTFRHRLAISHDELF